MRVLIADDDPVASRVLKKALENWGYETLAVTNGNSALELLRENDPPRVAILDWMMPGLAGPDICRKIRSTPGPYIYMLLLTANSDPSEVVAGMNAGADDYIKKPFNPQELQARLRAGARIVELHEELRVQATRDPLTGLMNRRAILDRLAIEVERTARQGAPLCVGMADIDHFKRINDTYGHTVGDTVLRETASRMLSRLRPYDLVGRYGGEEFTLIFPNRSLAGASAIAERIRGFLASTPVGAANDSLIVTVSFGIAEAGDATNIEDLLRNADAALFEAKNSGRNRVACQSRVSRSA